MMLLFLLVSLPCFPRVHDSAPETAYPTPVLPSTNRSFPPASSGAFPRGRTSAPQEKPPSASTGSRGRWARAAATAPAPSPCAPSTARSSCRRSPDTCHEGPSRDVAGEGPRLRIVSVAAIIRTSSTTKHLTELPFSRPSGKALRLHVTKGSFPFTP